ncbi:NRDE family protein [Weeksellaceae bacterium KMM 9724]|uniref:NRDE family protein n=1 Tax=Profundicola chukchiensis TaxID=2961959 RepID=UPI00243C020F|nr:NRDE family protein [Profundicola chukchiensis]MDG4951171.1 NRDE family protein [Profundicola chukchiensis]
MCILSIIRTDNKFTLTHNRDEDVARITSQTLITKEINNQLATFPMDIQSQGTWILTSSTWSTAILNGGFKLHQRKPPYKHSRGLFPYMLLAHENALEYVESLDLNKIEPFTQVMYNHKTKQLHRLVWDGIEKHLSEIQDDVFVISSSTLYDREEKKSHESAIKALKSPSSDELARLHKGLSWSHNPDIPMLKTTSQVQIISNNENKSMKFTKFVND